MKLAIITDTSADFAEQYKNRDTYLSWKFPYLLREKSINQVK